GIIVCSKSNSVSTYVNEEIVSQLSFPVPLFFRPSFVYRNKTKAVHSFELKANVAQALAHFVLENGEAISLQAAPFGSVYGNEKCTLNILSDFIAHIKKSLAQKKIHTITVKHYPACYAPALHDIVLEAFLNNGFQLEYTEQNQYLPLDA